MNVKNRSKAKRWCGYVLRGFVVLLPLVITIAAAIAVFPIYFLTKFKRLTTKKELN